MDQVLKDALNQILGSRIAGVLAQVAVGLGLLYAIDKLFKVIEEKLSDDTKLEIAVWLLGRKKFGPKVQPWPDTFVKVFDRVFGKKHLSWKCFWRCGVASLSIAFVLFVVEALRYGVRSFTWSDPSTTAACTACATYMLVRTLRIVSLTSFVPTYLSLLQTRFILRFMQGTTNARQWTLFLILDFVITGYTGVVSAAISIWIVTQPLDVLNTLLRTAMNPIPLMRTLMIVKPGVSFLFLPCLLTSAWLWLYAASGLLLKAARRFDLGFEWFNRKFDIEKKPLQSIGLVAGVIVAMVYWAAAIVNRVVR